MMNPGRWVFVRHPSRSIEHDADGSPAYRTLDFCLDWIEQAEAGDRTAIAKMFHVCGYAMANGYPLPPEFSDFIGKRLRSAADVVGAQQPRGGRLKKIDDAALSRALFGTLRAGAAARTGTSATDYLRSDFGRFVVAELRAAGIEPKDIYTRLADELHVSVPTVKRALSRGGGASSRDR